MLLALLTLLALRSLIRTLIRARLLPVGKSLARLLLSIRLWLSRSTRMTSLLLSIGRLLARRPLSAWNTSIKQILSIRSLLPGDSLLSWSSGIEWLLLSIRCGRTIGRLLPVRLTARSACILAWLRWSRRLWLAIRSGNSSNARLIRCWWCLACVSSSCLTCRGITIGLLWLLDLCQ